jgi:hypothetical protein
MAKKINKISKLKLFQMKRIILIATISFLSIISYARHSKKDLTETKTGNQKIPDLKKILLYKVTTCIDAYNANYEKVQYKMQIGMSACNMLSDPGSCNKGVSDQFGRDLGMIAILEALCLQAIV